MIHNGSPAPVTIEDDGAQLYPGESRELDVTERVAALLDAGVLFVVEAPAPAEDPTPTKSRTRTKTTKTTNPPASSDAADMKE